MPMDTPNKEFAHISARDDAEHSPGCNKHEEGLHRNNSTQRSIILGELEDELERQLEDKAKRNELSVANVKSILWAVLHHEDVHQFVDYTIKKTDKQPDFQMKLTRAKAKELLDKVPQIAPLLCLPSPQKLTSEIDALINQELSEDSSDEEYQPHDETIDDDEEAVADDTRSSIVSPFSPIMEEEMKEELRLTAVASEQGSIGQRTRSKLSLSKTPLEAIEMEFIPPDITTDMYDTECDNQDWLKFLRDFVQPLDNSVDGVEANDDENDPEYNIMGDEEFEALDNEELRVDRAVKISRKEVNDLMAELFEYTQMHEDGINSDDDALPVEKQRVEIASRTDPVTHNLMDVASHVHPFGSESPTDTPSAADGLSLVTAHEVSLVSIPEVTMTALPQFAVPAVPEVTLNNAQNPHKLQDEYDSCGAERLVDHAQYQLIQQQLMQHTQMLLQTYLLAIGNPLVDPVVAEMSLKHLTNIKAMGNNSPFTKNSFIFPTLQSSFNLIEMYSKYVQDNEDSVQRWNIETAAKSNYKKNRWANLPAIHPQLMEFCLMSDAFPYPLYIPSMGFGKSDPLGRTLFLKSEDYLIAHGLEYCESTLDLDLDKAKEMEEACELIQETLVPLKPIVSVAKHIRKRRGASAASVIKYYFTHRQAPPSDHYVVPIIGRVPLLYKQDAKFLPNSWHHTLYKIRQKLKKSNSIK
ncbi:Hypothetical protein NTJ_03374 [Nesidiocoris tenuis]|uniref:Uncharacterized protein n=1 Tax=Nesidiocoris tenuis TaxID=355587 RepID=A0ABN7AE55_9HEMI|nr:Hypothetical protein NTJ_03374 [Nesidiocoris tenuis]